MCVYIYIYIVTCTRIHTQTHIHTCTHTCTHTCKHVHTHTHTHVNVHTHRLTRIHAQTQEHTSTTRASSAWSGTRLRPAVRVPPCCIVAVDKRFHARGPWLARLVPAVLAGLCHRRVLTQCRAGAAAQRRKQWRGSVAQRGRSQHQQADPHGCVSSRFSANRERPFGSVWPSVCASKGTPTAAADQLQQHNCAFVADDFEPHQLAACSFPKSQPGGASAPRPRPQPRAPIAGRRTWRCAPSAHRWRKGLC